MRVLNNHTAPDRTTIAANWAGVPKYGNPCTGTIKWEFRRAK